VSFAVFVARERPGRGARLFGDNQKVDAMSERPKEPPKQPPEDPELGPSGPRTPYPVDEPPDPKGVGSEPDYFPGKPAGGDLPKM
jgi:hypothetical protein